MEAGSIWFRLGLNTDDLRMGLDKAKYSMLEWRGETIANSGEMLKWGAAIAATAAPLAAIGAVMLDAANKAGDFGKMIKDNARDLGLTTEQYQRWAHVATATGSTAEEITGAIRQMSVRMKEAADPASDIGKELAKLGVSVTDSSGKMKSMDEVLMEIIPALNNLPEGFERNQAAMAIFSKSFSNIADLTGLTREQLQLLRDQAPVISEEKIDKMDEFKTKMALVNEQWEHMYADIGTEIIPVIEEFLPLIQDYGIPALDKLATVLEYAGRGFHLLGGEATITVKRLTLDWKGADAETAKLDTWLQNKLRDDALTAAGYETDGMGNVVLKPTEAKSNTELSTTPSKDLVDKYAGLTDAQIELIQTTELLTIAEKNRDAATNQADYDKYAAQVQKYKNRIDELNISIAKTGEVAAAVVKSVTAAWAASTVVGTAGSEMQLFMQREMEAGTSAEQAQENWARGTPTNTTPAAGTLGAIGATSKGKTNPGATTQGTPEQTKTVTTELGKQAIEYTKLNTTIASGWVDLEEKGLTHYAALSELSRIHAQAELSYMADCVNFAGQNPIVQNKIIVGKDGPDWTPPTFNFVPTPLLKTADFSSITSSGSDKKKDTTGSSDSSKTVNIVVNQTNSGVKSDAEGMNKALGKLAALGGALP